jgi:hypothetical protein
MKISTDRPTAPATARSRKAESQKQPQSKSFSETLDDTARASKEKRKSGHKQAGQGMPGEAQENPVALAGIVTGVPLEIQPLIGQTAAPAHVNETDVIQSIVQEILVVTEAGGPPTVDVQFNSTTLDGLRVRISGNKDEIAIRFSTSSESVLHLLKQHVGELSDVVQAKGLHVAPIQIEMRPAPVVSPQPGSQPRHGRGGHSDTHQEKRQR